MSDNRVPQHTPGTWRVTQLETGFHDADEAWVVTGDYTNPTLVARFAEYSDFDEDECLPDTLTANGNLIAAAPLFYAACAPADESSVSPLDWLSAMIGEYQERSYQSQDPDAAATCAVECKRLLDALKAAMAAAGGE